MGGMNRAEPDTTAGAAPAAPPVPSAEPVGERLLETVLRHAPLVIYALDAQGRFTLSEGKALEALGLRPRDVVGQSAFDVYADYPDVLADARRVLAGEAVASTRLVQGRYWETRSEPLRDARGRPAGVIG